MILLMVNNGSYHHIINGCISNLLRVLIAKRLSLFQRQDIAIEDWEGKSSFRIKPARTLEEYFTKYIQSNVRYLNSEAKSYEETHYYQL